VGGVEEVVVGFVCVVEVVAPTVVGLDALVVGGTRTGRGAVEATVDGRTVAGTVVEVGAEVVVVEAVDADVVVAATDVVVGFAVAAGAAVDPLVVVDPAPCRLTSSRVLDPPGGPARTSAPAHSPARPSSAPQLVHASSVRCCLRDIAIASSSTNGRPT
jgi:hypothetical protein